MKLSKRKYDGYIALLFAILNSDDGEPRTSTVLAVYDMKDNERLVAVFSRSECCAKFFGTDRRTIDSVVCRKNLKNHRFKLERVNIEEE